MVVPESLSALGILLFAVTLSLVFIGIKSKTDVCKHLCYILAAIFFSLFIYETFILKDLSKDKVKIEWSFSPKSFHDNCYYGKNYILGYGPEKDGAYSVKKTADGKTLYDVIYTIKDKRRYTPNSNDDSDEYRIFLGCSFIMGEGLNDDETFPYYYNKFCSNRYNIKNYAFSGYGTHQALRTVEKIITEDRALTNHPENVLVFYNFLWFHIRRAAGYNPWDQVGPWYEIEDGKLIYKGSLADKDKIRNIKFLGLGSMYSKLWEASNIYKNLFDKFYTSENIDDLPQTDIQRTLLMIKKMNTILSEKGIPFFLIIDKATANNSQCVQFFSKNKISTLCPECNIPDLWTNKTYLIYPEIDFHPTARLNALKAEMFAKELERLQYGGQIH